MRKFLLSAVALLMTATMLAVGKSDGSSKTNAIDFDWENGHKPALSADSWYRVNLSYLKAEANDPTLALYLTNLTDNRASVSLKLEASVAGQAVNQTSSYNIAAKDYQLWSRQSFEYNGRTMSLKQLMSLGLKEVYLQLTSHEEIALSAKVYETEDIVDDACSKAVDFDWSGVNVPKGEQWFRLNLSDVKSTDNKLKFVVTNNGSAEANVSFDMSLDCPASAVIEKDWVIASGAAMEDEFGRVFLDVLKEDYVYLKLTNDQPLTLRVEEEVVVIPPGKYDDFDCASAPELAFDTELDLTAGQHVYKVKRDNLLGGRSLASEFHVTNNGATPATLDVEVAFAYPVKSTVDQRLVIEGNTTVVKAIKDNVLKSFDVEWVYIRFITDQDLTATVGKRNIDPCINAVPFDWTTGASLAAGESQWYEVDITSLKRDKKHLTLAFTNHSKNLALVNVEVALDCDGTILPITLPIYGGLNIAQTIDYNLLKHSPLDRIYVGLSTDSHIEMAASVKDAIAADPTPCQNALNPEYGVEYTHEANTTKWYRISLDWLESTTDYSSFYLANKGSQRAHVTLGVVTDCQYTPSSRITLPMPTKFDLGILGPNVLGKLLKELARIERIYNKVDSKDIYLEIHSDQPIGFGLDVVNSTTNPCLRDDLITFDWNQGAKVEKGDGMQWYNMDLDAVKAAGKHVKLTFTNHTDSLVWAATMVSVDCPAKLTMPLIVPVPAHTCIDHVINYQLFAVADLHNIYIGVVTDGALELKAESIEAAIVPPADCLAAKKIVSGEEYVQNPGAQWYQFPMSLIDEMGNAIKLSFENRSNNHATLTAGVSVGCEYAPVTCAKAKVLRNMDMSLNLPKQLVAKLRGLIDPAITDFYLQLTTDQTIAFSIKNQNVGANACSNATVFDWKAWEQNGLLLEANKEEWFKVDWTDPVKRLMDGEDITLIFSNLEDTEIEVDLAASPTCPVLLSLEKSLTIPAGLSAGVTVSLADLVNFIKQYDEHNLLGRDYKAILKDVNAFTLYNKLNQILIEHGYYDNVSAYVPMDRLDALFARYGEDVSLVNLKKLLDDPKKYISVAEIKWHLMSVKEKVQGKAEEKLTFDNMIALLEKYGDKIPYVDAEQIINNADLLLPYIGTANVILDKCKQYITTDNLLKIVERCKDYVPFAALKELKDRVETYLKQHLPDPSSVYIYAKSTGDLMISSEVVTPEGCADAELLDWTKTIDLSTLKTGWYRLDISNIHQNQSDVVLSLNNNTGAVKKLSFSFYEGCSPDGSAMSEMYLTTIKATAPEGLTTEKVPYAAIKYLLGDEIMELYAYLEIEGGELNEACLNAMLLDDPNVPHTIHLVAGQEQWFKVATNALDKLQYSLKVSVDAEVSEVTVSVSSSCNVEPVVDTTVVLNQPRHEEVELSKNVILDKWSKYSDKVSGIDTAYVCVLSTGNITLTTDTVSSTPPTDPDDCKNAMLLDWRETYNLSKLASGWYKFDISDIHANKEDFVLSINNDMGDTTEVTMSLYLDCESEAMGTVKRKLSVGLTKQSISYSQVYDYIGLVNELYIYFSSSLLPTPPIPPVNPCDTLDVLNWKKVIKLSDLHVGELYKVDITGLYASGKNIRLMVNNDLYTDTAELTTEVYLDCQDVTPVAGSTNKFAPGTKSYVISIDKLTSIVTEDQTEMYLKVVDLKEVTEVPDQPCDTTIYETDVLCPGDTIHWRGQVITAGGTYTDTETLACGVVTYVLEVTELVDGTATIDDTDVLCPGDTIHWRGQVITAGGTYTDTETLACGVVTYVLEVTELVDGTATIDDTDVLCPGDTIHWRGQVITAGGTYTDTETLACGVVTYVLEVTEISCKETEYKTIEKSVCDGDTVVDPYDNGKEHTISSLVPASLTWETLVPVNELLDSVYIFVVTPIVAPDTITLAFLQSIPDAMPTLVAGQAVDVTGTVEAIQEYYDAHPSDTVAPVEKVTWTDGAGDILTCDATTHTMSLLVEAGCGFKVPATLTFDVTPATRQAGSKDVVYVCAGDSYTGWAKNPSEVYAVGGPYTYPEEANVDCTTAIDTLVVQAYVEPTWLTEAELKALLNWNLVAGQALDTTGTADKVLAHYANVDKSVAPITGVDWTSGVVDELTCDQENHAMTLTLTAGCNFSKEIPVTFAVTPATRQAGQKDVVYVCAGDSYTGWAKNPSEVYAISDVPYTYPEEANVDCTTAIDTLVVKAYVEPTWLTEAELKALLGWNLVAGQALDTAGTAAKVLAHYANVDKSVAPITGVDWTAGVVDALTCDQENHAMTLTLTAGCNFSKEIPVTFAVTPATRQAGSKDVVYVCAGETYTGWAKNPSQAYAISDVPYTYPAEADVDCTTAIDTLVVQAYVEPTWLTEAELKALLGWNLVAGQALDTAGTAAKVLAHYANVDKSVAPITGVDWTSGVVDALTCDQENHAMTLTLTAGCNFSKEIPVTFAVTPVERQKGSKDVVYVCPGATYTGWAKNPSEVYAVGGPYTYPAEADVDCATAIDTLIVEEYAPSAGLLTEATICPGESMEWNGYTYNEAGEYTAIVDDEHGCDRVDTLRLSIPDPENTLSYDNLPAVSKYGHRLLVINLNAIDSIFGWEPAEEDVQWFKVVGDVDVALDALNGRGDDVRVATGHYYTLPEGSVLPDEYYALIEHAMVSGECDEIMRTTILTSSVTSSTPQLLPTVARPSSDIRLLNLNPSAVTEIRVYTAAGELLNVYNSSAASEFLFKTATLPGYYMVEVQTDGDHVTLRYIVK